MKDNEFLIKLEELNQSYMDDGYYEFGKYIKSLLLLLKKFRFFMLISILLKTIKKRLYKKEIIVEESDYNDSIYSFEVDTEVSDKIAIYTCITGNYDNVVEPIIKEKNVDYLLFTNNKNLKSKNWKVIYIDDMIQNICKNDNVLINRYIKLNPHKIEKLNGYNFCIYIDGNIRIISDVSSFINSVDKSIGIAMHKHCGNICIEQEIKDCRRYGKGNYKELKKQVKKYFLKGFPKNYGMLECNVIVTDITQVSAKNILNNWWEEFLYANGGRDQIVLPYVLWSLGIKTERIAVLGDNVHKNPKIKIESHK